MPDKNKSGRTPPDDQPGNKTYKLIIPYYPGDAGDGGPGGRRLPFPNGVISWLCTAIRFDGAIYDGSSPFRRNRTIDITVDVSNGGNATVEGFVTLYWSDPMPVFGAQKIRIDGLGDPVPITVPAFGQVTSPPITLTPDAGFPKHFCLLAEVSSTSDQAHMDYDIEDRHYGQHNVTLMSARHKKKNSFSFYTVIPLTPMPSFPSASDR